MFLLQNVRSFLSIPLTDICINDEDFKAIVTQKMIS